MKLSDLRNFLDEPSKFDVLYKGEALHYLDDAGRFDHESSRFFIAGEGLGPVYLIHVDAGYRGDGFEQAHGAYLEALPDVEVEDQPDAYLVPGATEYQTFDDFARERLSALKSCPNYWEREAWEAWHVEHKALALTLLREAGDKAQANGNDYPELAEGYYHADGGGIKNAGDFSLFEADEDEITFVRKCGHTDCAESRALAAACREVNPA